MKMKNEKTKLIIWALVALVIGVIIGAFLIGPMTTTGDAKRALSNDVVSKPTIFEKYYVDDAGEMFKVTYTSDEIINNTRALGAVGSVSSTYGACAGCPDCAMTHTGQTIVVDGVTRYLSDCLGCSPCSFLTMEK